PVQSNGRPFSRAAVEQRSVGSGLWTVDYRLRTPDYRLISAPWRRAGGLPHPFGHDADLLDSGALGRVDDLDDLLVAQRARRGDEHRFVLALLVDVAQAVLELLDRHVLLVDRDVLVRRVLEDNLADVDLLLVRRLRLGRQVDVDALRCERKR